MPLGDFSPGIDAARAVGIKVERAPYPEGDAGITRSLQAMIVKIREGYQDPRITDWRRAVFARYGIDGRDGSQHRRKMEVLLDEVRAATIYDPDSYGAEVIQAPAATLCLAPGLCLRGGDCDDLTVLVVCLLLNAAIPARIVKQAWTGAGQQHVLAAGQDDAGEWIRLDPSTRLPAGSSHAADEEVWIDPMGPVGTLGDTSAEIIMIGRGPRGGAPHAHPSGGSGGGPHHGRTGRRFHNGRWWDWGGTSWVLVEGASCGRWGAPVIPGAALAAEAARALSASGGAPVSETWTDGTLYLFSTENGAVTIRPCIGYLAGPPSPGLGITTVDDVSAEDAKVDGLMESTNTAVHACAQMAPTDVEAWDGYYKAWKSGPHATWAFYAALPSGDPAAWGAMILALPGLYREQLGYEKQIPVWQQKVHQACAGYTPPPAPPTPQPPPDDGGGGGNGGACATGDIGCQVAKVAKVVGITGLVLAGAYGIYKVVQVASDVTEEHLAKQRAQLAPARRRIPASVARRLGYARERRRAR